MAPLTKDMLEVTNSATDTNKLKSGTPAKTDQAAGHLRADAVSLEVPVKVHGSRVTEVVRDVTPHTEPFEEQTSTMIVFPQGAVIRMSTTVAVGQMLVVTNNKTRQDAICRVVKVRTFSNLQGYVEVEFTHKQPGYWNVYFPSEGAAPGNKPAQPTVVETPTPIKKAPVVAQPSEVSWAPAPLPEPVAQKPVEPGSFSPAATPPAVTSPINAAPKPAAPFISIGSQEEVQPAATTITAKPPLPVTPRLEAVARPLAQAQSSTSSVVEFPAATPIQAPTAIPLTTLPADSVSASAAPELPAEAAPVATAGSSAPVRSSFGSLSGGASLNVSHAESAAVSESVLSSSDTTSVEHKPGNNWMLIAACVAVLFAAGVGAMIYLKGQSANRGANASNPPVVTQPVAAVNANTAEPMPARPASSSASANSSREAAASVRPSVVVNGNPPVETHDAPVPANRPSALAKQSEPRVTNDMMSATLNSHPVSTQRTAGEQGDAPAVDAMAPPPVSENNALTGIGSSGMASPPAPELKQDGPVKIGGQVKEPRLLSSTLPMYPALAKQSNTQGDVVIRATIDKAGHVAHMDVVSGPVVLRQAALDALSRWKYEPSKLDGQPVSVQMLVTIKFRR
jgi:periplasmic protein TonB